jgi:hypothetical protein
LYSIKIIEIKITKKGALFRALPGKCLSRLLVLNNKESAMATGMYAIMALKRIGSRWVSVKVMSAVMFFPG